MRDLAHRLTTRQVHNLSFLIGFDGFIDNIYRVVESRKNAKECTFMQKMHDFSDRVIQASHKSTNIELVCEDTRLGGNGPILASSLLALGTTVSLIGALGYPKIDPIFHSLEKGCKECITVGPAGHTDALEFNDGKLLLGKHTSILTIDEHLILERVGKAKLINLLENSKIFASANWTMIFGLTAFWKLLDELLPTFSKKPEWMFVDIADPAKRLDSDIKEAIETLSTLQKHLKVVLGLNVAEAERVAHVMNTKPDAKSIQRALNIEQVVIHAIEEAESASSNDYAHVQGPHVKKPRITTGGGDNFNAGYMVGLGLGLNLYDCLTLATHTSGYYVEFAKSPSLHELAEYLK